LKITNHFNLPAPVVKALSHDDYSRGESNRSVTQLIDSPRYRILKKEHSDIIEKDVSDLIWIALGKAVHFMFEQHASGKYLPEERLFADVAGWTISGAIDLQFGENQNVTLSDFKCTSVWSVIYGSPSWEKQLNFYAWLAEKAKDITVKKLTVVAILRDWKMSDYQNSKGNYPPAPIMEVDIPLWSQENRTEYVEERVAIHQEAEFNRLTGDPLPHCTDEERWKTESKWAVKKPKNKRASKVFSSAEEAQEYVDKNEGLVIEERPSVPNKCVKRTMPNGRAMSYCPISDYCEQYQQELKGE